MTFTAAPAALVGKKTVKNYEVTNEFENFGRRTVSWHDECLDFGRVLLLSAGHDVTAEGPIRISAEATLDNETSSITLHGPFLL